MKGGRFSCASPASLAVCTSIDRKSIVSPTIIDSSSSRIQDLHMRKPPTNAKKHRKSTEYRRSTSSIIDCNKDMIKSTNSSRYLLNDSAFFDLFPDDEIKPTEPSLVPSMDMPRFKKDDRALVPSLVPVSSPRILGACLKEEEASSPAVLRPCLSTRTHLDNKQVVVLRVSLHCKGCEGKVRKHISKMQGVTSFDIDSKAKKVTVTGNVTPLGVLNSVSKVKNAQFWSSPPRCSASF